MKIRSMSHEYKMNEQWYGMPPKCRKRYRDELKTLRRRERRVLDRMVEDLVIEELGNDSDYWDAELDDALDKLHSVFKEYAEAEHAFEYYGDEVDWDYYESRFTELRKRVSDAYRELCAVG